MSSESGLDETIAALQDGTVRAADLSHLSDLSRGDAKKLATVWPTLTPEVREKVVRQAEALAIERVDLEFGRLLRIALTDESAVVRQLAVAALWEDEGIDLLGLLSLRLASDPSPDVRAEAAKGLGRFAEQAATADADDERSRVLRSSLAAIAGDESAAYGVRRGALESVGVFGADPAVRHVIQKAYDADDQGLAASALYAMGKSQDPRWLPVLIEELASPEIELRFEAARAAGAMGDEMVVPELALLCDDEDTEVRQAAIISLGQIGGRAAGRVLERLAEVAPESDAELVAEAREEALLSVDPLRAAAS